MAAQALGFAPVKPNNVHTTDGLIYYVEMGGWRGCVALTDGEGTSGGDECQSLRLDGFSLPTHKTGR